MSQISPQQEIELITEEANELLIKLNSSYILLQNLNNDIESRPFSTRIHGQFDHELKKSQSIISKLSHLLRKYHSFDFDTDNLLLQSLLSSKKPITASFINEFKDLCLKIEKEWRIGTKLIESYHLKYGNNNNEDDSSDSLYHSDNDARFKYKRRIKNRRNRARQRNRKTSTGSGSFNDYDYSSRSNSCSPGHTFKNPNKNKMELFNLNDDHGDDNDGKSEPIQIQKQNKKRAADWLDDHEYNAKIGKEFIPYMEEERLSKVIRGINDDLQYLIELNTQVNDLVKEQQTHIDDMENNVAKTKENIEKGGSTLMSIRKSPATYALLGGISLAAFGTPALLIGVSVKAAVAGAFGFGTVGAVTGSLYAKKANETAEQQEENLNKYKENLINDDNEDEHKNDNVKQEDVDNKDDKKNNQNQHHFKTKPRKRHHIKKKKYNMNNFNNDYDDDDDDIWDARN